MLVHDIRNKPYLEVVFPHEPRFKYNVTALKNTAIY